MKILSPKQHAYLDYLTVIIFAFSPKIFGLTDIGGLIAYLLAGVHLLMTLFTNFPLGAFKLIPFPLHGWVERIVGPFLVLLPFIIGFGQPARTFYIVMGVIIILVGLLTDYRKTSLH